MKKGEDYIGVSVVFFCHDGKGNFVMAKRGTRTRDENGRWDIGSGGLKFGEKVEDALKREIMEEYGVDVLESEFLGYRDVHREHNGKPTHWIGLDFKVLVDREKVILGEPEVFEEIGWFRLDNLPENMHSQLPRFFKEHEDIL